MKSEAFPTDNLFKEAVDILDRQIPEQELRGENLTKLFMHELHQRVKNGELINININGQVRKGKSTLAISLCHTIKRMIESVHGVKRPLTQQNICRDQGEYSRVVKRRPVSLKDECDVIDEWAELETTGYNSTIEEAFLKQFSDVQAGRYYHRIACSPTDITDPNTDILLQVVSTNVKRKETLCLLRFRLNQGSTTYPVLLGHVIINVSNILNTPLYKEYLRKKEEKWELMVKHNVRTARELEYAQVLLAAFTRLSPAAEHGFANRSYIKYVLKEEADKRGLWFSIIGSNDMRENLEGMCDLKKTIVDLEQKRNKAASKAPGSPLVKHLNTSITEARKSLGETVKRQEELSKLWDRYQLL